MSLKNVLLLLLAFWGFTFLALAQQFQPQTSSIYHKGWIDLNKNGKKDIYEDPAQPVEKRLDDLIAQMNLEEKTAQMATLYGWHRVLKDSLPTPEWKNEIWKDGIGNIDEHLNGFIEWGIPTPDLPMLRNVKDHVRAMNKTQEFFIEQTRLGIPADFTDEGIRGVEAYGTTDFPTQLAMGNTWDKELVHQMGLITGKEARAMGYTNVYAPILDVARDQRWGRLEESYGESPYLVAQLGMAMTRGMQKDHTIVSTVKHYALYSANFGAREGMARTDPQIPFREALTLLIYPFKEVFEKAHAMGVMASYNDYDGVPIIGSYYWLTEKLRHQFGFKGYVVSDSDALEYLFSKHHVAENREDAVALAVNAGLNVRTNFSSPKTMILPLRKAVKDGKVSMQTLNSRVRDILRVKFWLGLFDHPYIENAEHSVQVVNNPKHKEIALRASRECIVLLKNDTLSGQKNAILPLSKNLSSVAVIGPNATNTSYSGTHYGPQGVRAVSVLEGIQKELGNKVNVRYAKGCDLVDQYWPESEVLPRPPSAKTKSMMDSAVAVAKQADVAIMVMGGNTETAGENKSRTSLALPGHQLELIKKVYATGTPVVMVFINSQPISFNWVKEKVPAIVEAWYPGEYGGTAVANVLFGDYNPGGKLTLTFPRSVGQLPMNFPSKPNAQTDAGDKVRLKGKLYPFGYGLSYTTFKYSNLQINPKETHTQGAIKVSFEVTNTGTRAGDEVVQMYIHELVTSVTTYEKKLRGFDRVHLEPGETKTVHFTLTPDDMGIWNKDNHFVVEPGTFKVMVGASSEDIKLNGTFELD